MIFMITFSIEINIYMNIYVHLRMAVSKELRSKAADMAASRQGKDGNICTRKLITASFCVYYNTCPRSFSEMIADIFVGN